MLLCSPLLLFFVHFIYVLAFLCLSSLYLFIYFISLVPSVSLCSCSSWSLSALSVLVHFSPVFFCIICLWFSPSLWLLSVRPDFSGIVFVGWINNLRWGEVEVPFCWRKVTSLSVFSMSLFFFWVDPGQPIWPVTQSLDRVDDRVGFQNYAWEIFMEQCWRVGLSPNSNTQNPTWMGLQLGNDLFNWHYDSICCGDG